MDIGKLLESRRVYPKTASIYGLQFRRTHVQAGGATVRIDTTDLINDVIKYFGYGDDMWIDAKTRLVDGVAVLHFKKNTYTVLDGTWFVFFTFMDDRGNVVDVHLLRLDNASYHKLFAGGGL